MSDNTVFKTELEERINKINEQIESYLPEEKGHQSTIFEAMNYSVRAGGTSSPTVHAGDLQTVHRRSTAGCGTVYGSY